MFLGRKYSVELSELLDTYVWATKAPIDRILEFAKRSAGLPLYAVGSGGSFSAATFASEIHQHTGTISKPLTPLEFLELASIDDRCAVLMVTAGGNNRDILSAFDRAVAFEPDILGVLCASTGNQMIRRASEHTGVLVHATGLPRRDGFLATNSLLATEVWLARAYANSFSSISDLPDSPRSLLYDGMSEGNFGELILGRMQELGGRDTIVILHDSWGRPAAVDAESKLTEAGLVNVHLADYRNFAHGRHNWLDKNRERTGIVALVTPSCSTLAAKTLNLIPSYVPRTELWSDFNGPAASLNLLIKIMHVVKFFGDIRGIDPGRPQVAPFGRRMYHLAMPKDSYKPSARERTALLRKFPSLVTDKILAAKTTILREFVRRLENARFGGIALDYDGTICDPANKHTGPPPAIGACLTRLLQGGILVGIATGRGGSVREDLQRIVPKKHWRRLLVGYYNGADLGYLDDDSKPDNGSSTDSDLKAFFSTVRRSNILPQNHVVKERPMQISILSTKVTAEEIISKMGVGHEYRKVKVVESGHSVDLLADNVSKINLVSRMREEIGWNDLQILCIGDKGRWPGNDFELLNTRYSLSVDDVSEDSDTCWNTLAQGIRGERGVLEYLRGVNIYDSYFMLNLGVKE